MELQVVDFDTALELKELGLDSGCLSFYNTGSKTLHHASELCFNGVFTDEVVAPTQALVCKCIREDFNLSIEVSIDPYSDELRWGYLVFEVSTKPNVVGKSGDFLFKTYEDAEAGGIKEALEILNPEIKNKQ